MGWAAKHIQRLTTGETVQFRPIGNSMRGRINSGQLCTLEPVTDESLLRPDVIVLCRVRGAEYLHLIKAVRGGQYLIGNNNGGTNGWITARAIFGRCTKVED